MKIYSSLTDALRALVTEYGAAIVKDSRFWGLLTDAYPFISETTRKDMFLLCVRSGYMALIADASDATAVAGIVDDVVAPLRGTAEVSVTDTAYCLYCVAIALGKCGESHRASHLDSLEASPQPTPSFNQSTQTATTTAPSPVPQPTADPAPQQNPTSVPNPTPPTTPAPPPTPTSQPSPAPAHNPTGNPIPARTPGRASVIGTAIAGLVFLCGSLLFYKAYYHGLSLFFILLITVFLQTLFCSFSNGIVGRIQDRGLKSAAASVYASQYFLFLANSVIPLLFFITPFRNWSGMYVGVTELPEEGPSIITLLFAGFLAFVAFSCCIFPIFEEYRKKMHIYVFRSIWFWSASAVSATIYILVFLAMGMGRDSRIAERRHQLLWFQKDYHERVERNDRIRSSNKDRYVELAFKGIRPGEDFGEATRRLQEISTIHRGAAGTCDFYIDGAFPPLADLLDQSVKRPLLTPPSIEITQRTYGAPVILDKYEVYASIYNYDDKVAVIRVSDNNFKVRIGFQEDFGPMYLRKYGPAELRLFDGTTKLKSPPASPYDRYLQDFIENLDGIDSIGRKDDTFDNLDDVLMTWNFRNGSIIIGNRWLAYVSADFMRKIGRMQTVVRTRRPLYEDSVARENALFEERWRQKRINDSMRREEQHRNAVKEI